MCSFTSAFLVDNLLVKLYNKVINLHERGGILLDEYKELCRVSAEVIPNWTKLTKNELCRAYVLNKGNEFLQNAYLSAILYKYWNLIGKYYYMSSNCATPEECYSWLVDSVSCCVNLASWDDPKSSIYRDPNGPDKVINRCMKCARLTYYQYINRKKRRNDFGILSIEDMKETFGNDLSELDDYEQEVDVSSILIRDYIHSVFAKKDYFVAFMLDCIISTNVFDVLSDKDTGKYSEFNLRKLCKELCSIDDDYLHIFAQTYDFSYEEVRKAYGYVELIPSGSIRKKVLQSLEALKHSSFIKTLSGEKHVN